MRRGAPVGDHLRQLVHGEVVLAKGPGAAVRSHLSRRSDRRHRAGRKRLARSIRPRWSSQRLTESSHASKVGPPSLACGPGSRTPGLVGVAVDGISHALNPQRVAAPGDEQLCHLDEALLARPRNLGRRSGHRLGVHRDVGERLGDRARRDQLGAHPRHVAHVALGSPLHQLLDELMKLRVLHSGVEPQVVVVGIKDNWHAVVDR